MCLLGFVHNQAQLSRERTHTSSTTLYNHIIYLALLADTQPVRVMKYALSVTSRFSGTETPGEDRLRIFLLAAGQQSNCQMQQLSPIPWSCFILNSPVNLSLQSSSAAAFWTLFCQRQTNCTQLFNTQRLTVKLSRILYIQSP